MFKVTRSNPLFQWVGLKPIESKEEKRNRFKKEELMTKK